MIVETGSRAKRAVGYIRVSTAEQKEEGYSLLGQRKNIEMFAEKQGYELIDVYADEGISGRTSSNVRAFKDCSKMPRQENSMC